MRDASGLWLCLLGIALGTSPPVAGGAPAGTGTDDQLQDLLEFLGDAETGGDEWNGFFDSLPERLPGRPDDTRLPAPDPVAAEETKP